MPSCSRCHSQAYIGLTLLVLCALRRMPPGNPLIHWVTIAALGFTIYGPHVSVKPRSIGIYRKMTESTPPLCGPVNYLCCTNHYAYTFCPSNPNHCAHTFCPSCEVCRLQRYIMNAHIQRNLLAKPGHEMVSCGH
jgi:hypothetical protein